MKHAIKKENLCESRTKLSHMIKAIVIYTKVWTFDALLDYLDYSNLLKYCNLNVTFSIVCLTYYKPINPIVLAID